MATKRAPMTFDVETPKAKPAAAQPQKATEAERKLVATRIPPDLYRQAKARAALDEVSIQEIVETALREFIARGVPAKSAS